MHLQTFREAAAVIMIGLAVLVCVWKGNSEPVPVHKDEIEIIEPIPEETAPEVRYELTDSERDLVERVVMAESGSEPHLGQMAVAQCILNDCERSDLRPAEAVEVYQYAKTRPEPSESVKEAVRAVFDNGEIAVNDTILWFYAPDHMTETPWHETQRLVCQIGGHKFFGEILEEK